MLQITPPGSMLQPGRNRVTRSSADVGADARCLDTLRLRFLLCSLDRQPPPE